MEWGRYGNLHEIDINIIVRAPRHVLSPAEIHELCLNFIHPPPDPSSAGPCDRMGPEVVDPPRAGLDPVTLEAVSGVAEAVGGFGGRLAMSVVEKTDA